MVEPVESLNPRCRCCRRALEDDFKTVRPDDNKACMSYADSEIVWMTPLVS